MKDNDLKKVGIVTQELIGSLDKEHINEFSSIIADTEEMVADTHKKFSKFYQEIGQDVEVANGISHGAIFIAAITQFLKCYPRISEESFIDMIRTQFRTVRFELTPDDLMGNKKPS